MVNFNFELIAKNNQARLGRINTAFGIIDTPAFMPVGTAATVKAIKNCDIKQSGAQIILGNTYHLMLRPGADLIEQAGGLRKFMNWDLPILTDSGGFQVMSLSKIRKINDNGVEFQSHIDGKKYFVSPEESINIQKKLDSTITMIFDECIAYPASFEDSKNAMIRSLKWAERSKNAFTARSGYGIFGIVQGGVYRDLRLQSAKELLDIGFDGYAIGGLAVGEGQDVMFEVLDYLPQNLPENKARYLMGVGKPSDIVGAVLRGVDMFDCVIPTRSGRTGQAFTDNGQVNIRNSKYSNDFTALDNNCKCYGCKNHTKSYLHHLTKSNEILSSMLLSEHNIFYYQRLMQEIRKQIANNNFTNFARNFIENYNNSQLTSNDKDLSY